MSCELVDLVPLPALCIQLFPQANFSIIRTGSKNCSELGVCPRHLTDRNVKVSFFCLAARAICAPSLQKCHPPAIQGLRVPQYWLKVSDPQLRPQKSLLSNLMSMLPTSFHSSPIEDHATQANKPDLNKGQEKQCHVNSHALSIKRMDATK
jgi:hypothetical protein